MSNITVSRRNEPIPRKTQPTDTEPEETENLKSHVTKEIKNINQKPPNRGCASPLAKNLLRTSQGLGNFH